MKQVRGDKRRRLYHHCSGLGDDTHVRIGTPYRYVLAGPFRLILVGQSEMKKANRFDAGER